MHDRDFGLRALSEGILKDNISPDMAYLHAYGLYLMHGGTPDEFNNMSEEDIQIMYTSYMSTERHNRLKILEGMANILNRMMGGGQ